MTIICNKSDIIIKNKLLEYNDNLYYQKLFNTDKFIDSCVYHYAVLSIEYLNELKDTMLFATYKRDSLQSPSVYIYYEYSSHDYGKRYYGIQLKSMNTLPIYSNGTVSISAETISYRIRDNTINITHDFNYIIYMLNISGYEYYNQLIK